MILWLLIVAAWAEPRVVRQGDTVESIAGPSAEAVRAANGIAPGAQPLPGVILEVPSPAGTDTMPAIVLSLAGSGTAAPPGAVAGPLARGQALGPGTTVCTSAGSYATVRLATTTAVGAARGHDEVTLLAETCLTIRAVVGRSDAHISLVDLDRGALAVRLNAQPGSLAVRTASGVTAATEGGFRITVEEGATRTEALDRPVAVIGAGKELVLEAGFGSRVRAGEGPSRPVRLLDPGSPVSPPEAAALRRPDFDWVAVDRALGYRVEISTNAEFTELVRVEDLDAALWRPDDLFLPYRVPGLWWRVSSFDRTGFLGKPSAERSLTVPPGIGP